MRLFGFLLLPLASSCLFTACESLNQPLTGSDYVSPLDVAGGSLKSNRGARAVRASADGLGAAYAPGEFLNTTGPQTPFFTNKPEGNATAEKMLPLNTPVKFIADEEEYFKVETMTGDVGYVPALMVDIPMDNPDPLPGIIDLPELPPEDEPGGLPELPDPDELGGTSGDDSEPAAATSKASEAPAAEAEAQAPPALPEP